MNMRKYSFVFMSDEKIDTDFFMFVSHLLLEWQTPSLHICEGAINICLCCEGAYLCKWYYIFHLPVLLSLSTRYLPVVGQIKDHLILSYLISSHLVHSVKTLRQDAASCKSYKVQFPGIMFCLALFFLQFLIQSLSSCSSLFLQGPVPAVTFCWEKKIQISFHLVFSYPKNNTGSVKSKVFVCKVCKVFGLKKWNCFNLHFY